MGAGPSQSTPTKSVRRLESLDGLRTLAVLLVFAGHLDQRVLTGGFIGVEVFFVISGYLITALLLRERERYGRFSLRNFYVRRVLRLWPALVLFLVVITPIAASDHIGRPVPDGVAALFYLTDFWANYTQTPSLVLHTWSLAVEEQFYLVWPAFLAYALRTRLPLARVLGAVVIVSVAITYATSLIHRLPLIQFLPNAHVAELVSGILLAVALDRRGELPRALRWLAGIWPAACAVALLFVGEVLLPVRWWVWPVSTIICWPLVAHLVTHREGALHRIFSTRPAVWLGQRSYGFYLWHYAIVELLARSLGIVATAAAGLALTLVATTISYRFWERPFLALKERFTEIPVRGAQRIAP